MKLTAHEVTQPLWQKVEAELRRLLEAARVENEQYLPIERTTQLRARINLLKDLLAMAVPATAIPTQPTDDA